MTMRRKVSDFFQARTKAAMRAAMATTTRPIGLALMAAFSSHWAAAQALLAAATASCAALWATIAAVWAAVLAAERACAAARRPREATACAVALAAAPRPLATPAMPRA